MSCKTLNFPNLAGKYLNFPNLAGKIWDFQNKFKIMLRFLFVDSKLKLLVTKSSSQNFSLVSRCDSFDALTALVF